MATKGKKGLPPKLHKFMHQRNPYRTPPSFKKLALKYPEFRAHCNYDVAGKVHLDFKNPSALRALTICLLHQDFGLKVRIPEDRLVPTLPLRLNYLLWLEDLLTYAAHLRPGHTVLGVDVGCGAACVYSLLGAQRSHWCMLATEKDDLNFTTAQANVCDNNLQDNILVHKVEEGSMLKGVLDSKEVEGQLQHNTALVKSRYHTASSLQESQQGSSIITGTSQHKAEQSGQQEEGEGEGLQTGEDTTTLLYDFIMCNPPFFESEEDAQSSLKTRKQRGEPTSAPTGAAHEKITPGGEVAFLQQMIEESQQLRDKVRMFTSLIGTKSHIKRVKAILSLAGPASFTFTEFCQGRTMRWGVAWTFDPTVQLSQVRSKKEVVGTKPLVLVMPRSMMSAYSVPAAWSLIKKWLTNLKLKVQVQKTTKYYVSASVKAFKVTWLHHRRRKRQQQREKGACQDGEQGKSLEVVEEMEAEKQTHPKRQLEDEDESHETEREHKKVKLEGGDQQVESGDSKAETRQLVGEGEEGKMEGEEEEGQMDGGQTNNGAEAATDPQPPLDNGHTQQQKGGRELLRCNLQVKQTGGLISLQAYFLSGSLGKDGLNQLIQYMRNQLKNKAV